MAQLSPDTQRTTDMSHDDNTTVPPFAVSQGCYLFGPGQEYQCEIILDVRRVFGLISMLACLIAVFLLWLFKKYREFTHRLLIYLNISTFLVSCVQVAGNYSLSGFPCTFQAIALTYSEWSQLLWLWAVTLSLFVNAVMVRQMDSLETTCHVVCWLLPLVPALAPALAGAYGPNGAYCWFSPHHSLWRWVLWCAPAGILLCLLILALAFLALLAHLRLARFDRVYSLEVERQRVALRQAVKPLLIFPVLVAILRIPPLLYSTQQVWWDLSEFWLTLVATICGSAVGLVTMLLLVTDREMRARLTWSQIKAAWQIQLNHQTVTREYPIMFRGEDEVRKENNQVVQFVEYDRVDYDKLVGNAGKSQSCLEE